MLNMFIIDDLKSLITSKFCENDLVGMVKNYANLCEIKIEEVLLAPSSQKVGDSYQSKIVRFRVDAYGTNERGEIEKVSVNVITKVLPSNIGRRKTFRSSEFFENEIIFYCKVWSSIREFFKLKHLEQEFGGVIPLLLAHHSDGENDFISLEDLSCRNFDSIERDQGLDYFHTMKVLDAFAKFHALSLAFKDQKSTEFHQAANCLKEVYFSEELFTWNGKFQETLFELVRDATKKELPQKYYDKIDAIFKDDFYKKLCVICEKKHSHLSGITQGDAWLPNFLFQKDGDDIHTAIIDFQLARWAPFSNDVTFFLFTCVEADTLSKLWDDFINGYAVKMKEYLSLLGSSPDIFTIEQFRKDIKENIIFSIAMTLEGVSMSLVEGFDLDLIKSDQAIPLESVWEIRPFEDQERRQKVANVIKFLVDKELI